MDSRALLGFSQPRICKRTASHEAAGLSVLHPPLCPVCIAHQIPIAAAATFGSFGDIVTIIQLAAHLCDALNDVSGAPAEIEALSGDLDGYMLILTQAGDVLLREESSVDPRTREAIEGGLRRCKDTLRAIQRHVDSFAVRLQPSAGRTIMLAYVAAVRWRLFGARKEVAALHARLDKQLSFVQMCLSVAQSKGQRALHDAAKRNGVVSEQILLLVHKRPRQMDAGASVMQVIDKFDGTAYPAFSAVPIHMLPSYLEPLTDLVDPDNYRVFIHVRQRPVLLRGRSFAKHAKYIKGGPILLRDRTPFDVSVIFETAVFLSGSGERHVLLGILPSRRTELVTRVLSDVLHREFSDNVDAGLYAAEKRTADFIHSMADTFDLVVDMTQEPGGGYPVLDCLEWIPDLTSLMMAWPFPEDIQAAHRSAEQEQDGDWRIISPPRAHRPERHDPVTHIFRALAYRQSGTRQPPWPGFRRTEEDDAS